MTVSAYCFETISRAQLREEEPGRAQQTILVEEMELRVKGEQGRECWTRKGCINRTLWRDVVGTPQIFSRVLISNCI